MRIWLRLLPTVSLTALLAGCATSNPYDDAVAAKLAEIDAKLSKIVENQTPPPAKPARVVETTRRGADVGALTKIKPLPEKPTKAEVAAYAKAIFDLSFGQNTFSSDDQQHEMIRRIGPGFLDELTPYLNSYYFRDNLAFLVAPQDRAEVLRRIPDEPQWMTVLPFVGLEPKADIRLAILEAARKNTNPRLAFPVQPYLPILAEDPKAWAEFVELSYVKPFLRSAFLKSIEDLEPAARQEKFRRLWEGQKDFPYTNSGQRQWLLQTAARGGVQEALAELLIQPKFKGDNVEQDQRNMLTRLLPDASEVPPKEISAWYRTHRDQLRFDPEANCYRLDSTKH